MRGTETKQATMLSLLSPEQRVPRDHPLRRIKQLADAALQQLSPVFDQMYSAMGRPSVPPERLLKARLLMAFYSVRSERLFCELLDYNLMFRWFLDMNMIEESFDHSSFSLNRERLLEHEVAARVLAAVVEQARAAGLMSDDHFNNVGLQMTSNSGTHPSRPDCVLYAFEHRAQLGDGDVDERAYFCRRNVRGRMHHVHRERVGLVS